MNFWDEAPAAEIVEQLVEALFLIGKVQKYIIRQMSFLKHLNNWIVKITAVWEGSETNLHLKFYDWNSENFNHISESDHNLV